MLRPLILTTDLRPGGLPLRMVRLAIRLSAMGLRPIVGCLAGRGDLHQTLENAGLETFACQARGAWDVSALARLWRIIRRTRPDLIHASLFHANVAARLLGRLDRSRPVITSTVTIEIERRWHRWGEMLTAGLSTLVVANSRAVASHVCRDLGADSSRVVVVPNGLDLREIDRSPPVERGRWGLPGAVPLLAWAGRLDPVKDVETFVDVVGLLHEELGAFGVVVGDGPRRAAIERHVAARRLGDVVRLVGWSDDVAGWLKAADALVLCSRTEGAPNVVLEAMACGCPVVASDIESCSELLGDGARGLLAPPGDAAAFARAVAAVLTQTEQSGRREAAAAYVRREHDLDRVAERWVDVYRGVMGR